MLSKTSEEYILNGSQWPSWKTTISYSFKTYIYTYSDFDRELELGRGIARGPGREIIRDAMDAWEAVCGVEFVEVRDSPSADVRIAWMPSWESDGRGGVLGVTNTWSFGRTIDEQTVTFDWADSGSLTQIYDTALHELGHVLGISHSNVRDVVLSGLPNTPYANQPGRDVLQPDDIAAARAIWGPPDTPPVPTTPTIPTQSGGAGDDTLHGGAGNDKLYGEGGNDQLWGEGGNDTLLGGAGNDILLGGAGVDWIWGGTGNDQIWSEAGGGHLFGGPGQDILFGGAGNDVMAGGSGGDILLGGAGNDLLQGGRGHASYEPLSAPDGNDRIWGEAGNDKLYGGDGDDFLAGGPGNDTLYGGDGADYLTGEAGDDTLVGGTGYGYVAGTGIDVLAGGAGNDSLIGGDEGETFFGQGGADTFDIAGGVNWVMDFDDADRLSIGMTLPQVQAAATQKGAHLHVALAGGGDLYLAYTTLAELEADNLI